MTEENRTLVERARGLQDRVDAWLRKSPSIGLLLTGAVTFVVGKLVEATWTTIAFIAGLCGAAVFVVFYLSNKPRTMEQRWGGKIKDAFRRSLAAVTQAALIVLAIAILYAAVGTVFTRGTDEPQSPSAPPPTASPAAPPTEETPTGPPTDEPAPSPTTRRARPTSTGLQEVALTRSDLRGVIFDYSQTVAFDVQAAEPWDFSRARLCSSARVDAPDDPGWTDTIMFDNYYDESASSSSASFYSEEEAKKWVRVVLESIDRCNIQIGPTHPRIAGEDETWRFRTRVETFDGRLNIDRVVVRVDNVVLQVVVSRYEGDNQTVVESVAERCIERLVELMKG